MSTSQEAAPQGEMSFLDHLEELRWHVIRSIIAIIAIGIVMFVSKRFVFDVIIFGPRESNFATYNLFCNISEWLQLGKALCLQPTKFELINVDITGQFIMHLKVSVILGFIVAFPYILWEVWRFIKPGLLANEQKTTRGFVLISSLLFMIGVAFGYYILSPFSLNFFATYSISSEITNRIALSSYIAIITTLTLASGIMFELPMVVYFLSKLGLLTPSLMRAHRRHALVVILIIAAIITPADVWTQVLVSVPVYFLYEISILVSARVQKNALKEEEAFDAELIDAPSSEETTINKIDQ